jgi:hypothetical protein
MGMETPQPQAEQSTPEQPKKSWGDRISEFWHHAKASPEAEQQLVEKRDGEAATTATAAVERQAELQSAAQVVDIDTKREEVAQPAPEAPATAPETEVAEVAATPAATPEDEQQAA